MDPLTQGALGAAVAQTVIGRRLGRRTWWLGALGGMAPDLDVLIRSRGDPLLELEFHRHFTHSLAFIPVGGLLVALPFILRKDDRDRRKWIVAATTAGWATHGLLDAFTSYGTMLWWPFSRARVAWDWISVLDPTYTLILIFGVIWAWRRAKKAEAAGGSFNINSADRDHANGPGRDLARASVRPALLGLVLSSVYMGLCGIQQRRAQAEQRALAQARGHTIVHGRTTPLFFTNLVWRSIYQTPQGQLYADAFAVPWWYDVQVFEGERREGVGLEQLREGRTAEAADDAALFSWFSDDLIFLVDEAEMDPQAEAAQASGELLCDARYSADPSGFESIFCARLGPEGVTQIVQPANGRRERALARYTELLTASFR